MPIRIYVIMFPAQKNKQNTVFMICMKTNKQKRNKRCENGTLM